MADVGSKQPSALVRRWRALVDRIQGLKPVRVIVHYTARRGPILSAGLSYQAIFSVFAAVFAGFSAAGLVLGGNFELREGLFDVISTSVPGLLDRGEGGAIDPDDLFAGAALGWAGLLALLVALATAIGWLASARDAVRDIAELAAPPTNFLLLRLRDLGLAVAFGVALILSAALSIGSTTALAWVLDSLGVDEDSMAATIVGPCSRSGARLRARPRGARGALPGARRGTDPSPPSLAGRSARRLRSRGAEGAWPAGSSTLTSSNPLLASFAVIVGLLIWFNLVSQVILLGAAWVVVSATDAGVPLDPIGDRRRREAEARLRLEIEEELRAEIEGSLPRAVRWLARRRRRM